MANYASIMKGFTKLAKKLNKYAEQTRKQIGMLETEIICKQIQVKDLKQEADKSQSAVNKLVKDYKLEV